MGPLPAHSTVSESPRCLHAAVRRETDGDHNVGEAAEDLAHVGLAADAVLRAHDCIACQRVLQLGGWRPPRPASAACGACDLRESSSRASISRIKCFFKYALDS